MEASGQTPHRQQVNSPRAETDLREQNGSVDLQQHIQLDLSWRSSKQQMWKWGPAWNKKTKKEPTDGAFSICFRLMWNAIIHPWMNSSAAALVSAIKEEAEGCSRSGERVRKAEPFLPQSEMLITNKFTKCVKLQNSLSLNELIWFLSEVWLLGVGGAQHGLCSGAGGAALVNLNSSKQRLRPLEIIKLV